VTGRPPNPDLNRRDFARRGLMAGGAAFAALAAPAALGVSGAFGQAEGEDTSDTDSEILVGLIGFEQQAVDAFDAALASGTVAGLAGPLRKLADQERQHVQLLITALAKIGGKPKRTPRTDDVPGLTEAQSRENYLDFLISKENQLVASYTEGVKQLGDPHLLQLSGQICANVGQHLVVLRQALGLNPLPTALPSGSETH
jgi:hypothetical protein